MEKSDIPVIGRDGSVYVRRDVASRLRPTFRTAGLPRRSFCPGLHIALLVGAFLMNGSTSLRSRSITTGLCLTDYEDEVVVFFSVPWVRPIFAEGFEGDRAEAPSGIPMNPVCLEGRKGPAVKGTRGNTTPSGLEISPAWTESPAPCTAERRDRKGRKGCHRSSGSGRAAVMAPRWPG